jgi:glycosyltransferase involved in cell wall biosynthesis
VDHTAGVLPFRRKFEALAAYPDIDLTVVAPARWIENYRVVGAAPAEEAGYRFRTGAVVWPGYENRAFFRSGLGSAIRRAQPDIIHLWEEPFSLIALQALWHAAIWAPHAKVIFFSSDNLSRDFRYAYRPSWFYAGVERLVHRRCAAGTAVSEEVVEVLHAKGFRRPIVVVPHGIDLSDFEATGDEGKQIGRRASPAEVKERLGLDPPVIGYVGRLLHQKGVDLLLRAVDSLGGKSVSLAIVGDGPARAELEALATGLNMGDRVRFLPAVPHGGIAEILACMDILVLPSRTTPKWKEQFGRVLIEGMAAGCVVIGSSSGAIPEVLGDAGMVFREDDVESLAQALRRAREEPGLAAATRIRGRRRVTEHYTWEVVANRLRSLYERLL